MLANVETWTWCQKRSKGSMFRFVQGRIQPLAYVMVRFWDECRVGQLCMNVKYLDISKNSCLCMIAITQNEVNREG